MHLSQQPLIIDRHSGETPLVAMMFDGAGCALPQKVGRILHHPIGLSPANVGSSVAVSQFRVKKGTISDAELLG
jgi:hypothetical protein